MARAWRELADPPARIKGRSIAVWTSHEVIAFQPNTDRITPETPRPGFMDDAAAVVWTGDRVLIAGLSTTGPLPDAPAGAFRADVVGGKPVVYEQDDRVPRPLLLDPATGTWSVLPDHPLAEVELQVAVSTGDELLFWGGQVTRTGVASGEGYALRLPAAAEPGGSGESG